MWNTCQPIEGRRPDRFRPPHCPWPECPAHLHRGRGYRPKRCGSYRRACDPLRRIPRFRCPACRRTFSKQTFATSYYLKRPELLHPVAGMLVAGSAHRQIARHLGCAPATVTRLSVRLGRHAGLLQEQAMGRLDRIEEPVVFDHFETFVRSQQERLGIATAVGQRSWFVYALDGARYLGPRRRARGKPSLKRAPMKATLGAVAASTRKVLESLLRKAPRGLDLISDENPAYAAIVRRLNGEPGATRSIRHERHANPDRGVGGDRVLAHQRDRAMFAVDLLHKLLRHSQAHHRRETIAFGRKTDSIVGRTALFAIWRNFIKRVTERRPCRITPAMRLGLARRPWTWRDAFAERLFERRLHLVVT
jgi:transposase-like protein